MILGDADSVFITNNPRGFTGLLLKPGQGSGDEGKDVVMSIDDETRVHSRFWVGVTFILLSGFLMWVEADQISYWEEGLLMLFGLSIVCYHTARWMVPY